MKKLKLLLAMFALCIVTVTATATENEPNKSSKNLRNKIVKLIGTEIPSHLTNGKDLKTEISLMLNNKNQIIVVSVDLKSTQENLESYVKGKLNYQKVSVKGLKKGEIYRVPLTIKQS